MLGPLPRSAPSVHLLVSSRRASASPQTAQVRRARQPSQCSFNDVNISGLQSFLYVQAPILARPPGCTHRCGSVSTGRPGRLRHAMNMWLPNMNRGIATRLYRAIGAAGLSPAGLRPCRPLPLSPFNPFNTLIASPESQNRWHYSSSTSISPSCPRRMVSKPAPTPLTYTSSPFSENHNVMARLSAML